MSSQLLRAAVRYAENGIPVLPLHSIEKGKCSCKNPQCKSPGKHPRLEHGIKDASTDPARIRAWWQKWPTANIGLRLDGLLVVDVDVSEKVRRGVLTKAKGRQTLKALEATHGPLKRALVQHTGSGGTHILFKLPKGQKAPGTIGPGIDVKAGSGGYIVAEPSNHESGDSYEWEQEPDDLGDILDALPTAPKWIFNGKTAPKQDEDSDDLRKTVAEMQVFEGNIEELRKAVLSVPNDEKFESRDAWLSFLAAIHHESDGSPEGLEIAHEWSDTWEHGNDEAETERVWESFGSHQGRKKTGRTILDHALRNGYKPPADFEDDDEDTDEPKPKKIKLTERQKAVARFNEKYAVILLGDKTRILYETKEESSPVQFMTKSDFETWEAADTFFETKTNARSGDVETVAVKTAKAFLESPGRRVFTGVTLYPGAYKGSKFNLWRGFSVKPNRFGDCDLFLDHVHDNICQGDTESYDYLIRWFAHMIQKPWEKPGVLVAIRGSEGVGKSYVSNVIGRLLHKSHVAKVSQPKHFTGQFNAHLRSALLVKIEEGFWAGQKDAESALKDQITGETLRIEPKGVDSFEIDSFHRYFLTTNEDWAVPASHGARRYFVLEAGEDQRRARAYFNEIDSALKAGGLGALLHFLQTLDLTDFDVTNFPETAALGQQKIASLRGVDRWWFDALSSGRLPGHGDFESGDWSKEAQHVTKNDLYDSYCRWSRDQRYGGSPVTLPSFSKQLSKLCAEIRSERPRISGSAERPRQFIIPQLGQARALFEAWIRSEISWN